LQSYGGGEDEAIAGIYGASVLSQCYKIDANRNGLHIRGYIGNQNFYKANKSYQSIFLNGRYVLNNTISSAISGAYAGYLMKRQYPFYVLHIDMPSKCVDVNVHPNKADVRFANNQVVYGTLHTVISSVLDGTAKAMEYIVPDAKNISVENGSMDGEQTEINNQPIAEGITLSKKILSDNSSKLDPLEKLGFSSINLTEEDLEEKIPNVFGLPVMTYEEAQQEIEESKAQVPVEPPKPKGFPKGTPGFTPIDEIEDFKGPYARTPWGLEYPKERAKHRKKDPEKLHKKFPDLYFKREVWVLNDGDMAQPQEEVDPFLENKKYLEQLDSLKSATPKGKIRTSNSTFVGTMFNTYIVYEHGEAIYIIDQHAAHERLIFDRLKEKMRTRTVNKQDMLVPYELTVNAFEGTFIRERMQDILDMGFDIVEEAENSFKVTSVPSDLMDIDIVKFFNTVLADISGYRSIKLEELLKDKLASEACKAAVKGGQELSTEEIDTLFAMMEGNMGLKCPHGRPVVVKMERKQLEKMFKRIV
jgi:DNA mismatch repair protein MutL